MNRIDRVAWLSAGILLSGISMAATPDPYHGLRVEPPKSLHAVTLVDAKGPEVSFPLKRDSWQLVFFGYTHCPDVCPMTLHKTSMLMKQLGSQQSRLTPVFISIDSARDQPEALNEYIGRFDVPAVGLTGDPEALKAIADEFGVMTRRFQGKTALAYSLEHSSFMYLLDPAGRVRMLYPGNIEIDAIASDLKKLWQQADAARHSGQ